MSMILPKGTIEFLDSMTKLESISFCLYGFDEKTKHQWQHQLFCFNEFGLRLRPYIVSANGNAALYCRDTLLLERLHATCRLFNYDTRYEDHESYGLLMFVAPDGDCPYIRGERSITIYLNGKLASRFFEEERKLY